MGAASGRYLVVSALGITQILAWGSSYYLLAVLAAPIVAETGWSLGLVVGGLSLGLATAGLVSPLVGRTIQRSGGRSVMAFGSLLLGLGLACLGLAQSIPLYMAAWVLIGLGMSAGLYDSAFATLGRLYAGDARRSISALTLFGGLASTVCWPLSAFLLENLGWRGACLVYAGIQLFFALPLHALVLPRGSALVIRSDTASSRGRGLGLVPPEERPRFVVVAIAVALASVISGTVSVHLLTLLQARDMTLAAAVALGALVGPAQVSARALEMGFGRLYHPIWTKLAATILVATGLGLLLVGFPLVAVALVFYGAGIGIESIARGTLPLALFDPRAYAAIMGAIAMPSLIAQAVAPSLGAFLLEQGGPRLTLSALTAMAVLNVVLVAVLWAMCRSQIKAGDGEKSRRD